MPCVACRRCTRKELSTLTSKATTSCWRSCLVPKKRSSGSPAQTSRPSGWSWLILVTAVTSVYALSSSPPGSQYSIRICSGVYSSSVYIRVDSACRLLALIMLTPRHLPHDTEAISAHVVSAHAVGAHVMLVQSGGASNHVVQAIRCNQAQAIRWCKQS